MQKYIQKWKKRFTYLETVRNSYLNLWKLIAEVMDPMHLDVFWSSQKQGQRGDQNIFDTLAYTYREELTNALHSTMASPFTPFLRFLVKIRGKENDRNLNEWSAEVDDICQAEIRDSNHHVEMGKVLDNMTAYGFGNLMADTADYMSETYGDVRFTCNPFYELYPIEGVNRNVDALIRKFPMSYEQIVNTNEFREGVSRSPFIQTQAKQEADGKANIIHVIAPNQEGNTIRRDMEYISLYFLDDKDSTWLNPRDGMLAGYEEQPFSFMRWKVRPNEAYGRGPAEKILGDALSAQSFAKLRLQAGALAVFPPYLELQNALEGTFKMLPGARNIAKQTEAVSFPMLPTRLDFGQMQSDQLNQNIHKGMHMDSYRLPDNLPQMTAQEVRARLMANQGIFGPLVVRFEHESKAVYRRMFWILYRAGKIPPPPTLIPIRAIDFEIIGPLAMAQRSNEVMEAMDFAQKVTEISQAFPDAAGKIKGGDLVEYCAERYSTSFRQFLRTADEMAEVQQQQMMQQNLPEGAKALKDMGSGVLALKRAQNQ